MDNVVKFKEAVAVYTNFITPPDFIDEEKHTVLLIDVDEAAVQNLAAWCKMSDYEFNVYLYNYTMNDLEWLGEAVSRAESIIIDTTPTELSAVKDRIAEMDKSYTYGPKNFLVNTKRIKNPLEYFQGYKENVK